LFCVSCNRVINHVECIEGSKYDAGMFFEEFESGNFDNKGYRILPLSEWKHNRNIQNRNKQKNQCRQCDSCD
ncbi:MAG: hypothetical protein ACI4KE_03570, partial [Anaerovoracaceae bacterium]